MPKTQKKAKVIPLKSAKAKAAPKAVPAKAKAKKNAEVVTELKVDAKSVAKAPTETAPLKVSLKGVSEKPKRSRKKASEALLAEKAGQMSQKWNSLFKKAQEIETKPYNMRQTYEAKTSITHKVLGWGYILANKNDRLEVLFKDGIRFLISNYKA